jgi:hypothetical protein
MHNCMQYTLRRIPKQLDAALRRRARREGKTLNQVTLEALAEGLGLLEEPQKRRSVQDLVGARRKDPELESALEDQRRIDPELWR